MNEAIRHLADIPRVHAATWGHKPAVEVEDRSLTYAELERRAGQAAGLMTAFGVKPGDRIA